MNRHSSLSLAVLVVIILVARAEPSAQIGGLPAGIPRGARGLFGGGTGAGSGHNLDVFLSTAQGYDTDVLLDSSSPDGLSGAFSSVLTGGVDYRLNSRRATVRGTYGSQLQYFRELGEFRSMSQRAGIGLSATLPGRNTLLMNQSATYSPSYYYGFAPRPVEVEPGDASQDNIDYAAIDDREAWYQYDTTIRLTHSLTRGHDLVMRGNFTTTNFVHENLRRRDTSLYRVEGRYRWTTARNTSASVGYTYRTSDIQSVLGATPTEHAVIFSVTHQRQLSATRRASFEFRLGSSTTEAPFRSDQGELVLGRRYWLLAGITASVPLSRDWYARANYTRSMEYIGTIDPVFADRVRAGIDGQLNRRVHLTSAIVFANGASSLDNLLFRTYTGTVEAYLAMTRALALYGNYRYYFYDYAGSGLEVPPDLKRSAVRIGLMLWVPVVGR